MSDTALTFLTVPLITAFIGYVTNWAAVKMIFNPREPFGIGRLKWQGIVYKLAPKFAAEIAATTGKVLSPVDVVDRVGADALVAKVVAAHPTEVDTILREVLDVLSPGAWDAIAPQGREQIRTLLAARVGETAGLAVEELGRRASEVLDLDTIIIDELSGDNAERLARVAEEVGARELRFIELYGGVFGFLIGLVQAAAYSVFGQWWTMPIVGAVVGLGTNWLAIQMIFRPLDPTRYFGLTYQGMFPKRQAEIARDYGRIVATEVLTPANLIDHLQRRPVTAEIGAQLMARLRAELGQLGPMLGTLAGGDGASEEQLDKVVFVLQERVADLVPVARPLIEAHLGQTLRLDELVEERLSTLDKLQFERMLRGIFEEDEIILVLIGGVLGGAVGALQGALVLGTGL